MEKVKVLGICGSARHASTQWAVELALKTSEELGYIETECINLGDYNLKPCTGCMKCFGWQHSAEASGPDCYEHLDDTKIVLGKMMEADGIILGTPVYALGVTGLTRIVMEKAHQFGPMSFTKFASRIRNKPIGVITVGGVDTAGQEVTAVDIWFWAIGIGLVPIGNWPTRNDPNPQASEHGALVSAVDARTIYGRYSLSVKECRTNPPTQGIRNERAIRNVGRHTGTAAMMLKLGQKALKEGGYASPELISFTKYSVKPKKGSWIEHLINTGIIQFAPKSEESEDPTIYDNL